MYSQTLVVVVRGGKNTEEFKKAAGAAMKWCGGGAWTRECVPHRLHDTFSARARRHRRRYHRVVKGSDPLQLRQRPLLALHRGKPLDVVRLRVVSGAPIGLRHQTLSKNKMFFFKHQAECFVIFF